IFSYVKQLETSFGRSGRKIRLKTALERNECNEFNFLFRDTAVFSRIFLGAEPKTDFLVAPALPLHYYLHK
ncbi:MAG: hypothetical protein J6S81_09710, partial [Treponema sp.]|nr:hypothetical protein [Treponema sp.]